MTSQTASSEIQFNEQVSQQNNQNIQRSNFFLKLNSFRFENKTDCSVGEVKKFEVIVKQAIKLYIGLNNTFIALFFASRVGKQVASHYNSTLRLR